MSRTTEILAKRINDEKIKRGWGYAKIAQKMTSAGVPTGRGVPYDIIHRGRAISADELFALAKVFDLTVNDLLHDQPDIDNTHPVVKLSSAHKYKLARGFFELLGIKGDSIEEVADYWLAVVDQIEPVVTSVINEVVNDEVRRIQTSQAQHSAPKEHQRPSTTSAA